MIIILTEEIKNSFLIIEEQFNKDNLAAFIECDYCDLCNYHFSLGLWIRNNLLTENSQLLKAFEENGIIRLDDISTLIIELFYLHMKNNIYNS